MTKIHEFVGTIERKIERTVRRGKEHKGETFYELVLKKEIEEIKGKRVYVFRGLVTNEKIWQDIEESNFEYGKPYLFKGDKRTGGYGLMNREEWDSNPKIRIKPKESESYEQKSQKNKKQRVTKKTRQKK